MYTKTVNKGLQCCVFTPAPFMVTIIKKFLCFKRNTVKTGIVQGYNTTWIKTAPIMNVILIIDVNMN